jgi:non-canonical (house-cleaning) NTP pyrophosphatase
MYSVPEVDTKYMDASICVIYDGKNYYIGFSPSFEYPEAVVDRVLQNEEIGFMEDIFGPTAKRKKRSNTECLQQGEYIEMNLKNMLL